jgi:hypothetical protein
MVSRERQDFSYTLKGKVPKRNQGLVHTVWVGDMQIENFINVPSMAVSWSLFDGLVLEKFPYWSSGGESVKRGVSTNLAATVIAPLPIPPIASYSVVNASHTA